MDVYQNALNQCSVDLHSKLDPEIIQPYLLHQNMLTNVEMAMLTNVMVTRYKKINDLMDLLPRKGSDWWKKFIKSLRSSTAGTAHQELADALEKKLADITGE